MVTGPRARIERWMPGVRVVRTYERAWLSRDLIAGVVLVTLLVPQGMAYAELAGLPAITGLYTTVVCLVAYALVGPSPILVLGPDSSLGPMIAATILPLAAGDQTQAIALAGMLALLVGLVTVGGGPRPSSASSPTCSRARSGPATWPASRWSSSSASCPSCSGSRPMPSGLVAEAERVPPGRGRGLTNPWALGIGLLSLAIILGLKRVSPRTPGHPRRGRGRHRAVDRARPRRHAACRSSACCPRASRCRRSRRSPPPTSRCCSRRRWASRWWPSATPSRRPAASPARPATRWTATRSWPASARPTSPPGCSRASRSAPAARAPPWPSSRARRRSSPASWRRRSCC